MALTLTKNLSTAGLGTGCAGGMDGGRSRRTSAGNGCSRPSRRSTS